MPFFLCADKARAFYPAWGKFGTYGIAIDSREKHLICDGFQGGLCFAGCSAEWHAGCDGVHQGRIYFLTGRKSLLHFWVGFSYDHGIHQRCCVSMPSRSKFHEYGCPCLCFIAAVAAVYVDASM